MIAKVFLALCAVGVLAGLLMVAGAMQIAGANELGLLVMFAGFGLIGIGALVATVTLFVWFVYGVFRAPPRDVEPAIPTAIALR